MKRKFQSVYFSEPLQRLAEGVKNKSGRINQAVERYYLLMEDITLPDLSKEENEGLIMDFFKVGEFTPHIIRTLNLYVSDSDLRTMVYDMSMAERITLLEGLGF